MKRRLAILVFAAALVSGCASAPPTVITPQGKAAYIADAVVIRVNELQAAAIQANATGGLSTATTAQIVQWTVQADTVLKSAQAGWQKALVQSWGVLKGQIPAADLKNPLIVVALNAVDALIATLGGK